MPERKELSAAEKARKYAKYYYQESAPAAAEHAALFGRRELPPGRRSPQRGTGRGHCL